jgi:hypothetical protein
VWPFGPFQPTAAAASPPRPVPLTRGARSSSPSSGRSRLGLRHCPSPAGARPPPRGPHAKVGSPGYLRPPPPLDALPETPVP